MHTQSPHSSIKKAKYVLNEQVTLVNIIKGVQLYQDTYTI